MKRQAWCAALVCLAAAQPGFAAAGGWAALLETAWAQRQAVSNARLGQADAARAAGSARLPDAPSLTLASRGDRLDPRRGAREWEAELAAPLWWPGQRERTLAVAEAERTLQLATLARERWQLAGELREAAWALRLAQADADAGVARRTQAEHLVEDIERRVRAGDLAPLDLNHARGALAAAVAEAARSGASRQAAEQRLAALAPGADVPVDAEVPAAAPAADAHPQLAELAARGQLARARLAQAGRDTRDAPELALALSRERDDPAQPWRQRARLALRVPLGEHNASAPRQAAAAAEQAEAQLALAQALRLWTADRAAAEAELAAARRAEVALAERVALAQQSLVWVEQAFRAGQLGAPVLLRTAAELADSRAQAERARLEAGRAVSRLNHFQGSMP